MPLPAGTQLGPCEVVGPLGAGGMGEVYKARDTRLDRVAVRGASSTERASLTVVEHWFDELAARVK
jgi:eukaryotic-like serine/threonine-protein kinase